MTKKQLWTKDDRYRMNNQSFEIFNNCTLTTIKTEIHQHDFYEVLFFLQGEAQFFVEGRVYPMHPGDMIVSNPGELHRVEVLGSAIPYERIVVWIHPLLMNELCRLAGQNLHSCFDGTQKNHYHLIHPSGQPKVRIRSIFDALLIESDQNDFAESTLQKCLMCEFLIYLNRAYHTSSQTEEMEVSYHPKIDSIVRYINQHLQDDLSLDFLASEFFISKYYLTRLFKQYTGQALHQFILQKRLAVAKSLIAGGTPPIQASMETGFVNYSHFSKAFKDRYGFSPSFAMEKTQPKT